MGDIAMVRVDYRLVHGQVGGQWLKFLGSNHLIILCDEVANDPFMVEIFQLAAPAGVKITSYSLEEGVKQWQKDQFGPGKLIVLFKYVMDAKAAYDMGFHYAALNIGQVPAGKDKTGAERKLALRMVFMSKSEAEVLESLEESGVDVYSQSAPMDNPVKMVPIVEKINF